MPVRDLRRQDISLSDLPLDLLCLPLMLILLSWLSITEAVLCLSLFALPLMGLYWRAGKLIKVRVSLLIYLLQLGIFYAFVWASTTCFPFVRRLCLWQEILFMTSFLLMHLVLFFLIRHNKFPRLSEPTCLCERWRNEALLAEYVRFDRFLLNFCLLAVMTCLLCSLLFSASWVLEIVLSHTLSFVAALIIGFELFHLAWLRKRLTQERWIPILDEANKPQGRIPRSEVQPALGVLPCVRLLVLSRGMLYLERVPPFANFARCLDRGERSASDLHPRSSVTGETYNLSPTEAMCYDTPFGDFLAEGESPEDLAQAMIDARFCGIRRAKPRRLMPYRIEVDMYRCLVHLMLVEIEDPAFLYIDCCPLEGKWWSLDEIQALLLRGASSPFIESEWQTLLATLLRVQGQRTL